MTTAERPALLVVADTTPLNYLVQLEDISLLPVLFGRVLVPRTVMDELAHRKSRPAVRAWSATTPEWLEVVEYINSDPLLAESLGAGERDAISLALHVHADLVLIDEVAGRKEAVARNLAVAGTIAVLLRGRLRDGADFAASLKRLRTLGFRMSDELEAAAIELYVAERDRQSTS